MMFGQFPLLGRAGRVEGTREFSVVGLPYVIVYAIRSESEIDILSVLHTRRLYPYGRLGGDRIGELLAARRRCSASADSSNPFGQASAPPSMNARAK